MASTPQPQNAIVPPAVRRLARRPRLRVPKGGVLAFLAALGPGLITTNAGNDAGGIATYSVAGASYGLDLLWVLPAITLSLIVVQEACARMGIVTGKGLAGLIREKFRRPLDGVRHGDVLHRVTGDHRLGVCRHRFRQ